MKGLTKMKQQCAHASNKICVYMQNFMFVGVSVQPEEDKDEEEHGKTVKSQITPVLKLIFFSQYH